MEFLVPTLATAVVDKIQGGMNDYHSTVLLGDLITEHSLPISAPFDRFFKLCHQAAAEALELAHQFGHLDRAIWFEEVDSNVWGSKGPNKSGWIPIAPMSFIIVKLTSTATGRIP